MWSDIIQCAIAVVGISLGIVWAWRNRNAPLDRIRMWLGLATTVVLILTMMNLRKPSDWMEVVLLILAWQLACWWCIALWRQIVNKEGQEPAKK